MHAIRVGIGVVWLVFWIGWFAVAFTAKRSTGRRMFLGPRGVAAIAVVILIRGLRNHSIQVHSLALGAVGAAVFLCGITLAVWARVSLGRNWGMPMTQRVEPELVTGGPYRLVRHPIYSAILLAMIGTALATSLIGLAVAAIVGGFFFYSARVEERNLTALFPSAYPAYREQTKMLVPFLL